MILAAAIPLSVTVTIGLAALGFGFALCLARLVIGPTLADRVVALDLMAVLLVGAFVLFGLEEPQKEPLRVAIVLALINFLGTLGFAIYLQRKVKQ